MKNSRLLKLRGSCAAAVTLALVSLTSSLQAVSQKFTSSGTFTPPPGVTSVTVECWGGGGAGGSSQRTTGAICGGSGGGGGAYAKKLVVPVTPGTPYTVTIPAAVAAAATNSGFVTGTKVDGANVSFTGDDSFVVEANGGQGGECGVDATGAFGVGGAAGAVGVGLLDVAWAGGNGGRSSGNGGGGGSGASDLGMGNSSTSTGAGAVKTGSDADRNGGIGGPGKTGFGNGNAGTGAPGGGGGGAKTSTTNTIFRGAAGGKGQIIITYSGAAVVKADNAENLSLPTSWVGGVPPDATGIASWDSTVTSANTTVLGADVELGSISIANPNGLVTIGAGNILTLNGGIDMSSATADLLVNCDLALGGSSVWNLAMNRTLTLGGIVSGRFSVATQGAGKVFLSGTNTYTGATAITGGTLQLGASDVIPNGTGKGNVSVLTGATLDLSGFSETINGLTGEGTVDNTAAGTQSTLALGDNNAASSLSGILQNSGAGSTLSLIKTGSGQLSLSSANTLSGSVAVFGGNLTLLNSNPLGNISGLTIGGAQLGFNADNTVISAPITLSGNATVIAQSSTMLLASLNGVIGGTGNLAFSTPTSTLGGADSKVLIAAASNFVGDVLITSSAMTNNMTVRIGIENALPTTAVVTLDGGNGTGSSWSDLDIQGFNQTLAGLKNEPRTSRLQRVYNGSATAATLTVNNTADYTFGGKLGKAAGNNLALAKSGVGSLTLSGASTHTGGTSIANGTLTINGSLADMTLAINGGTVDGTGRLTTNIDGTTFDAITLTAGTFTASGLALNVNPAGAGLTQAEYVLVDATAGGTITGVFASLTGATGYQLDYSTVNQVKLVQTQGGGYNTWASTNAPNTGGNSNADEDSDGVANGMEYVLGGTIGTNDLSKLPQVSSNGGSLNFVFMRDQASLDGATTVEIEVGPTLALWPDIYPVPAVAATNSPGVTVVKGTPAGFDTITFSVLMSPETRKFARLKVVAAQ